jgi:hypothetical protein
MPLLVEAGGHIGQVLLEVGYLLTPRLEKGLAFQTLGWEFQKRVRKAATSITEQYNNKF